MTIVNQGKSSLLWITPNSAIGVDTGTVVNTIGAVLSPYSLNLTVADCFTSVNAARVFSVWFSASRCHNAGDVPVGSVAVSVQNSGITPGPFHKDPIWIYWDEATKGLSGDRLMSRIVKIILHEFAHLFGAKHSNDIRDLMYSDAGRSDFYTISKEVGDLWRLYLK